MAFDQPDWERVDVLADYRGNAIRVGDTVLYPRMSGRSCELQEGEVLEIYARMEQRYQNNPDWEMGSEDPAKRYMIMMPFRASKFRIKPTRNSRGFYRGKDLKPVWIQIGENVVKG